MKTYATIETELNQRLLEVRLNRPQRRNAFTVEMSDELEDVFRQASRDDEVGAVILTGTGPSFCVGMDLSVGGNVFGLNEALDPSLNDICERFEDPDFVHGVRDTGGRVTLSIFACNKPVIAAINGDAVGIGATMTLAADFRLCATSARFGFVFGRIGIVPEACSSWFLPRLVGIERALEWTLTADLVAADEAQRSGLVRAVVGDDELLPEARRLAHRLIDNRSPVAIAMTRQMLWRNSALSSPLEAHRIDSLVIHHLAKRDGKEGVQAFLEKRPARFASKVSSDMPSIYPWRQDQ
ncbi:MAG TPA: crotonase/enoyl-CoA hydratase family protein [Steroidobacteraceae bacterium]|jgi:enoyl-CoA hydratase/carnithine racemase|nr:crotonase/enoyl-CoA hydratase family protein [Steroidobacteraceae bacterium]